MGDIYQADKRWQRLHTNAVPPLNDFLTKEKVDRLREVPPMPIYHHESEDIEDIFGFSID
jgi:hypothetical protein